VTATPSATLAPPALEYLAAARRGLDALIAREAANLAQASAWMAEAIEAGGLIRIFGTGHSRLLAEEIFFRAGGLAPTDAILEDSVSGYHDVSKSELTERLEGYGQLIVEHRRLAPQDVLIIVSQSGRNSVPIDVANAARARGVGPSASPRSPTRPPSRLDIQAVATCTRSSTWRSTTAHPPETARSPSTTACRSVRSPACWVPRSCRPWSSGPRIACWPMAWIRPSSALGT